jgi:hypothetical protein
LNDEVLPSPDFSLFQLYQGDELKGRMIINRVNACMEGGCTNPSQDVYARFDYFYYLAIYDLNHRIVRLRILDYQSQHGYEIAALMWLKQFTGSSGCDLKYEQEIDAIAGATISAKALVDEINENCRLLIALEPQLIKGPQV